jgi:hypothetical protein
MKLISISKLTKEQCVKIITDFDTEREIKDVAINITDCIYRHFPEREIISLKGNGEGYRWKWTDGDITVEFLDREYFVFRNSGLNFIYDELTLEGGRFFRTGDFNENENKIREILKKSFEMMEGNILKEQIQNLFEQVKAEGNLHDQWTKINTEKLKVVVEWSGPRPYFFSKVKIFGYSLLSIDDALRKIFKECDSKNGRLWPLRVNNIYFLMKTK